jgi:response regulator of citrate/malate metabolism
MPDWRVLIVDDDPIASAFHAQIVRSQPGFTFVAAATSSEETEAILRRGVAIDLILLDVELPGVSGITLMRRLRTRGGPEVIAITASRDPKVVQSLLQVGVVDYLVKPFAMERLQAGLLRFRDRTRTLAGRGELAQAQIDRLYPLPGRNLLPKGLKRDTLDAVRVALRDAGARFSTAEDVANEAALARVTARRYLEYLVSSQQAEMDAVPEGPGRPRKVYRLSPVPH